MMAKWWLNERRVSGPGQPILRVGTCKSWGRNMPSAKLTKRSVDLIRPAAKPVYWFDSDLPGFFLRVMPSGAKSWGVEYRPGSGRQVQKKRVTLGAFGKLAPEQARQAARQVLATVTKGGDRQRTKRMSGRRLPCRHWQMFFTPNTWSRTEAEHCGMGERHHRPNPETGVWDHGRAQDHEGRRSQAARPPQGNATSRERNPGTRQQHVRICKQTRDCGRRNESCTGHRKISNAEP